MSDVCENLDSLMVN